MPITRPNFTRTMPRPATSRTGRIVRTSGGAGASLSRILNGWSFAVRVWVAWEPPTAAFPTWIEVTQFIDMDQPITITWGRVDGVSDVNSATLSLTADNSDGRWCASNPNGAWAGLVRKGAWIKVDQIPLSGNLSTRYVGFINNLPTTWAGLYASSQIGASDRFERVGQEPALISQIQSEVLTDPNLAAGGVKGYWNLHETPSLVYGAYTYGDTSGQGVGTLKSASVGGAIPGTGFAAASVDGPGFDGLRAPAFRPPATGKGTVLTGSITPPAGAWDVPNGLYTGLFGTIEFWFQAVTTGTTQVLAALVDPIAGFAISIYCDATGALRYAGVSSMPSNPTTYFSFSSTVLASRVDDGNWHHCVVGVAVTGASGGSAGCLSIQDGYWLELGGAGTGAGIPGGNLTQLVIGGGYDPASPGILTTGAANICDVAWTWADINYLWNVQPLQYPPNYAAHYAAGATGNLGESTDRRVARLARYAGVPTPTAYAQDAYSLGGTIGQIAVYSPGPAAPWTNLSAGAHYCGTQAMGGRAALDVMREAARTENMPLFVDHAGYLTLQPSTLRQNTTAAWTVDSRDLDPSTAQADDFAYTTNVATITPNGQAAQTVVGGPGSPGALSKAKYGVYSTGGSLSTASLTPLEAQNLGLAVIAPRADPASRWSPIAVEAATLATQAGYGAAWYDAVLATTVSTPIRVTNLPAAAGSGLVDVLIEGCTETITGGQHLFAFSVSPVQGATYQLDSPTLGLIDTPGVSLAY